MIKFIQNKPAILAGKYLVVADLHLGIEREFIEKGVFVPTQIEEITNKLIKLSKYSKSLIILGDIKHKVPGVSVQELAEVPYFFKKLSKYFKEIIVIRGNHDSGLDKLTNVSITKELSYKNIGFMHGHALPSDKMLKNKVIVTGHIHPRFNFRDSIGVFHSLPCFLIGKYKKTKVIAIPAFNELVGGLSEEKKGILKYIKKKEILLLDLTKVK